MISARQQSANERNAQSSTGPATESGRAKSAKNATTHGLTTGDALLHSEDAEAYLHHMEAYRLYHEPHDEQEQFFVTQLGEAAWRLRRVRRFETGIFNADPNLESDETLNKVSKLSRYEAAIERSYYRAFRELERLGDMYHKAKMAAAHDYINRPTPRQISASVPKPAEPKQAPETATTNRTHSQNRTLEFPGAAAVLGLQSFHLEDEETQASINRIAEKLWKVESGAQK